MAHVALRDITARLLANTLLQQQAEQARLSERLDAMRVLAGGVAHEINNTLQIILGFSEMLAEQPLSPEQRADIDEIERAAAHGAVIVRQLLQYARQAPVSPQVLDLLSAVPAAVERIRFEALADGVHVVMPEAGPVLVRVDPRNLREMLEQLVANGVRASRPGRPLRVTTGRMIATRTHTATDGRTIPAGAYGVVSVRDDGVGMSTEVQRHIFEPFFTTRGVGQGAGLGLAAVQGMLAQNGGFLTLVSAAHAGSTFTLWFPVLAPAG